MIARGEHQTVNGASLIFSGAPWGLARLKTIRALRERNPNTTTLLCFRNLAGAKWDLADTTVNHHLETWAGTLASDEIIKVRLCYSKHQRHRVAHEVIAGPGYRRMSIVLWLKIVVKLRLNFGERLTVNSPRLVRLNRTEIVPMTGNFMSRMDKRYVPILGWYKATLHSRRRGFATAAVRSGVHMANITITMRHPQGVTMRYVSLTFEEKAAITTRLAIAAYSD